MKKIKSFFKNNPGTIIIFLVFLLILVIIPPFFDFPLNDDWAYAKSVKIFSETGNIKFSDWTAASFLAQLLWGYLFTLPTGFSFMALRISTIVLAFIGILCFYFILKELKFSEKLSVLGSLLLFFNPIFFNLSYTFMSDIPFISVVLLSLLFYLKFIKTNKNIFLILGTLFSIIAFLIRQHGIIISFAMLIYMILDRKKHKLEFMKIAIVFIIPIIILAGYQYWYMTFHGPSVRYLSSGHLLINFSSIARFIAYLLISITNIGFYLLPLAVLYLINIKRIAKNINKKYFGIFFIAIVFILASFSVVYYLQFRNFPFLGYQGFIISESGLGPKLLAGNNENIFPVYIWVIFDAIAIISAAFIVLIFAKYKLDKIKENKLRNMIRLNINMTGLDFCILSGSLLLIFLLLLASIFDKYLLFFDRYYTAIIPFVIILLLSYLKNTKLKLKHAEKILVISVILIALFSLVGTLDYVSWNKARWKGIDYLQSKGISPAEIDGGFEFNGWQNYEYALANLSKEDIKHPGNKKAVSWWFVVDDKYIVAFSNIKGYKIRDQFNYFDFWHLKEKYIYVLERT
jgi:hypothetical protein